MREPKPRTLLCTIGTSLLYPNLVGLAQKPQTDPTLAALAKAYSKKNWVGVATHLHKINPTDRLCGAEINSVTDLLNQRLIEEGYLHLFYSETDDGEAIAEILRHYFQKARWDVQIHCVKGLRDDDPDSFGTKGLRNLVKLLGEQVRSSGQILCAINATGGYKAQIAIAVQMGQALDIPVYYKHERFNLIIPFPPMPIALDFSLWLQANDMFTVLSKTDACEPWDDFKKNWNPRLEPLINRVDIDGEDYLELSATGQIFHETFHSRFQALKATRLPRSADASEKQDPDLRKHSYGNARTEIEQFLQKLTYNKSYVCRCFSTASIPNLPKKIRFRLATGDEPDNIEGNYVEGIYSNGKQCAKFKVVTTATDIDQLSVVVADLNDWLNEQ